MFTFRLIPQKRYLYYANDQTKTFRVYKTRLPRAINSTDIVYEVLKYYVIDSPKINYDNVVQVLKELTNEEYSLSQIRLERPHYETRTRVYIINENTGLSKYEQKQLAAYNNTKKLLYVFDNQIKDILKKHCLHIDNKTLDVYCLQSHNYPKVLMLKESEMIKLMDKVNKDLNEIGLTIDYTFKPSKANKGIITNLMDLKLSEQ